MTPAKLLEVADTYKVLMTLPSFVVYQDPSTFHTVLTERKNLGRGTKLVLVGEYSLPGLSGDSDLAIPAAMFRELVKAWVTDRRQDRVDVERDEPEAPVVRRPWRRQAAGVAGEAQAAQQANVPAPQPQQWAWNVAPAEQAIHFEYRNLDEILGAIPGVAPEER